MSTPIPSFAVPSPFLVTRKTTAGAYVKGKWVTSEDEESFSITASVQRLTPEETDLLPEGFRTRKSYRIYTETELRDGSEATGIEADQIMLYGASHTILQVEYWSQLMPHYKAIAVRNERNAT